MKHYALIPAKKSSSRCPGKNWRKFYKRECLVDFTFRTVPDGMFSKVIISTDYVDYKVPEGAEKHLRDKSLATRESCITDLMQVIIREYKMEDDAYLWLLNPTSPFREASDYANVSDIIESRRPPAIISVFSVHPFVWKNDAPLFEVEGKRKNTQDFKEEYAVENGMFYVSEVSYFRKTVSWYDKDAVLYKQDMIWSHVDIDTEDDFLQAQAMGKIWMKNDGRR